MQIQINTDANIEGSEAVGAQIRRTVERVLSRFDDRITRVEVHLSDQDGPTRGDTGGQKDKRCVMEARLEGRQPVAATHQEATVDQAVQGAADKLARIIDSDLGRETHAGRSPGQV